MNPARVACLVLLGCAALAPGAAAQQPAGEKYALLVGVRQYHTKVLRDLSYTEKDVEELAGVLRKAGYKAENILILSQKSGAGKAPSLDNIRATLKRWLDGRRGSDSLLLAFAGHGVQYRGTQEQFFCPEGATPKDKKTLLPLREMYEAVAASKAGFKLLVVDACRNDPDADLSRGGAKRPEVKLESKYRLEIPPEGAAAALFSCSENEKAYEHDGLRHSVFFHFFLEGLRGKADGNRDRKVTLNELVDYLQEKVPQFVQREFNVRQMPEMLGRVRGGGPLVMLAEPPPEPKVVENPVPQPGQIPVLLHNFAGHKKQVWGVALAPNGRQAATAAGDGTIRIWDTHSGQTIKTLAGHAEDVFSVAYGPAGNWLASAGGDKVIRLWNNEQGREFGRLVGHTAAVRGVVISGDNKWAASAGDLRVLLWDLKTQKVRWEFKGHTQPVYGVAISPDSWRLLSGGGDKTVRYWAIEKGKQEWARSHDGVVYGVALSPCGKYALSGSADKTMRLWDVTTGNQIRRFDHPDEVNGVAFLPDSLRLVSTCDDKKVRVWELATGKEVKAFDGHQALVYAVAVARDGRTAVSGSFDKTARLWRLDDPADLIVTVTWNTKSDVDLWVTEPDGTKCFYGTPKTKSGGVYAQDVRDGSGPEEYRIARAPAGAYKIQLQFLEPENLAANTEAVVLVRRHVGTPRETNDRYTVRFTKKGEVRDVTTVNY